MSNFSVGCVCGDCIAKKNSDLLQLNPTSLQFENAFVERSFTLLLNVSSVVHLCATFLKNIFKSALI